MDKESTEKLIKNTFQNSFNKEKYVYFIKNLLKRYDESKAFHLHGCYIPKAFENFVKTYERIGTYVDPEGKKIDLLIVYLKKETTLDRARTAQRNFVAHYLKERGEKDAGLVAFVSPEEPEKEDWRFSFVKMEYKFEKTPTGDVKIKEEFTPARRYSFLVGKNENSHTAQSCFMSILEDDNYNPKLYELEEAFSIEKVTKEFFEKYCNLFLEIKDSLDEIVKKDEEIRQEFQEKGINTVDFSKKLLGQIVFLYFLQKKGWFGVKEKQKWGSGSKHFLRELFEKKHCDYENFFNNILEPLFYEALRNDRSYDDHYFSYFKCKIPFLNGGLFDPLNDYDWAKIDILLPDTLFSNNNKTKEGDIGTGVLDVFDRYNFTVKEDEPLDKEVAIDPEMLGKVFENLLEVKDRKSKGTYYTPREIVHYMCQQSLINYIFTEVNDKQKHRINKQNIQMKFLGKPDPVQQNLIIEKDSNIISKEDIEKLIRYGDTTIENDNHVVTKGEESKTYSFKLPESIRKNAEIIDEALKNIRVCDPAIGSGAFPVGMMNEIIRARNTLTPYLSLREAEATKQSRTIYNFKRHAIQNCLYGVDIDPGAVEIAKLRLWLSLIVDEEDINKIKPLPNLDYKIMQGNSLISEFMGIDLDNDKQNNEKEKLFSINESRELYETLKVKKNELLNQPNTNKKKILRKEIEDLIINIFEKKLQKQKSDYFKKLIEIEEKYERHPVKQEREKEINREKNILSRRTGFNLDELEEQLRQYTNNRKIRPFFPWKLYFSEVFQEKDGFDVVIANPPYIRIHKQEQNKNIKAQIKKIYFSAYKDFDIYILFFEKGLNILKKDGVLTFITPDKYLVREYGEKIRYLMLQQSIIELFDLSRAKDIFEAATYPLISIIQKNVNLDFIDVKIANCIKNINKDYREIKISKQSCIIKNIIELISPVDNDILKKIFLQGESLSEFLEKGQIFCGTPRAKDYHKWGKYIIKIPIPENCLRVLVCSNIRPYSIVHKKKIRTVGLSVEEPYFYNRDGIISDSRWHNFLFTPKILIRGNDTRITAVLDEEGSVFIGIYGIKIYGAIKKNHKYLLALLNSNLYQWIFSTQNSSIKIGGNFFSINSSQILRLPYKNISLKEQKSFNELVDKIHAITKEDDYLANSEKQFKVHDYECQIDEMVYKLYNLTPEEIEIVEGLKNK